MSTWKLFLHQGSLLSCIIHLKGGYHVLLYLHTNKKTKSMDPPKAFSLRHRVMMTSSGKADKRATRTQTHSDTHRAAFNHEASCVYKNSLSCYIGPCVALNLIQDNLQILSFSYYCQDMNLTKLTKIIFISSPMF